MDNNFDTLRSLFHIVFMPTSDAILNAASKRALIFVPDMSLNGAQTSLYSLVKILSGLSYSITIISSEDGEYRQKYTDLGVVVAINSNVAVDEVTREFLQSQYDLVILNSSSCLPYLFFFVNTNVRTIWWLHETKQQIENCHSYIPAPQLLSTNISIVAAHPSVQKGLQSMFNYDFKLLPVPVIDHFSTGTPLPCNDKVTFFIPAAYSYIKGQDILLKVISTLPKEYSDRSKFIFCGYSLEGQKEYYEKIKQLCSKLPNVSLLGELSQKETFEYYKSSDCVIAPSRIDSGPASIIEAMMFQKLTLVSSNAGISSFISDCVNGFVFHNEDELFQRLLLIISDIHSLGPVSKNGRQTYEEHFAPDVVERKLLSLIET